MDPLGFLRYGSRSFFARGSRSEVLMRSFFAAVAVVVASSAFAAAPGSIQGKSDSSGRLPPRVKASGDVFRTMSWSDDKGDNIAVFSTKSTTKTKGERTLHGKSIFVDVYTGKGGAFRKVRTIKEAAERCELDLMNEFLDTSVAVTDLDNNGVGELTFAYRTACRSDLSPAAFKVMVLEGGKKWALRGTTRVNPGPGPVGGELVEDFKKAPPQFLEHATKVWQRFVTE